MRHSPAKITFAPIALMLVLTGGGVSQNTTSSSSPERQVLRLNGSNNGQQVAARVDQAIELILQTIGPGQYGTPKISSRAVRFEGAEFPKEQNPGGPRQRYRFHAISAGEAVIKIPHVTQISDGTTAEVSDSRPGFVVTIRVRQ